MSRHRTHLLLSVCVLLSLVLQPLSSIAAAPPSSRPVRSADSDVDLRPGFLFRALVTLAGSRNLARLEKTGVTVLRALEGDGAQTALVLADGEQLADLARLGFKPRAADELRLLITSQGKEKQWLAESLAPLLAQADTAAQQWAVAQQQAIAEQQAADMAGAAGATATPDALALQALRTSLQALTPEQIAGTADSVSVDDDADGLTNTQEAWWCTDPLDADTDDDGRSDGAEIQALADWMGNKRESAPGETPWPNWPPQRANCDDKDHDSIPNLAERWELGLNMDLESSDRDKFDDGQELFGVTYCPGGDLSCSYGDLPRSADSGYVGAAMPAWVKAPGKHPLVATFPVPEVDVVESSLHVQTVTTVTTDHIIGSGTEKSYSTAKTEGTSKGEEDTTTWNNWEESSETREITGMTLSVQTPDALPPGYDVCQGVPPVYGLSAGCQIFSTAADMVADICIEGGGFSIEQCKRGAKQQIQAAQNTAQTIGQAASAGAQMVSDGFGILKQNIGSLAGKAKDWIDTNFKLESCTVGLPAGVSCTAQFTGGTRDSNGGYAQKQSYSSTSTDGVGALGAKQFSNVASSSANLLSWYPMTYPSPAFVPTRTDAKGRSYGGSRTTTQTRYEEQTVTNGEAFSTSESWGNATAVDSAHAADLWFTYKVRNTGTEYAREIADLAFNVYIGDDPNPVYTYFVGPDLGGDGKFHNFMPGEEHTYTAAPHPAHPGADEGHRPGRADPHRGRGLHLRCGRALLPGRSQRRCHAGHGGRHRRRRRGHRHLPDPHLGRGDRAGRAGPLLPAHHRRRRHDDRHLDARVSRRHTRLVRRAAVVGTGSQRTLWCKHALSTADWWNVYTNGMGDGTEGFQDTPPRRARPPSSASTRTPTWTATATAPRQRLGTDPDDAGFLPQARTARRHAQHPRAATTSRPPSRCSTPASTTPTASRR